jgi:hypothetical protein
MHTYMKVLICFLTMVFWMSVADAADDYYVWVDENGVTNYSERIPQGYRAEHVTKTHRFGERVIEPEHQTPTAGSRPGAAPALTEPPKNGPSITDDPAREERAAIEGKMAETKSQNCEIGKRNLANLQTFARIRVKGPNGQEVVLTEEEKTQRLEQANQIIKDNC